MNYELRLRQIVEKQLQTPPGTFLERPITKYLIAKDGFLRYYRGHGFMLFHRDQFVNTFSFTYIPPCFNIVNSEYYISNPLINLKNKVPPDFQQFEL